MVSDLYLLWIPNEGWGVFDACTCPDPGAFPEWMYRKYVVPSEKYDEVFEKLKEIKVDLVIRKIVPTKEKANKIFPELSDLVE